jgi:hypothetical protein
MIFLEPNCEQDWTQSFNNQQPLVGRGSDRQFLADRLYSQHFAMFVDEGYHHFCKRSSSTCTNYADAKRRISFTLCIFRFSSSSWQIRSLALSAGDAGVGLSFLRSIFSQRGNDSALHPIIVAMQQIASHCVLYSYRCSSRIWTARSRASGEN